MSEDRSKEAPQGMPAKREQSGKRMRKPYRSPKLTEYGAIQRLTNTLTSGAKADGGGGVMNMMA